MGGGNTAAGTLSAMSSEYINTEIANYLVNNTALTADERNAIQQASAVGLGALIGASLSGNSTEVKQSAQMALRTEKFNRQLHPYETKWIKENAKEFAEENGITEAEAEKRLSQQAAKDIDMLWFLMLDDKVDTQAKAFLGKQSHKTFTDSQGKEQNYFVAKDNDFFEARKYAEESYHYNQAQGDKFIERNLQTGIVRTATDGLVDKAKGVVNTIQDSPLDTGKAVAEGVAHGVVECGKSPIDCVSDVVGNIWSTGKSSISETYHNLKGTDQDAINAVYGKDVSNDMLAVSASQLVGTVTEVAGAGKVVKVGSKAVSNGVETIVEKGLKSIDLQNLSRGATLKLPDGKYTYLGDGVFEGPDKGKIINTGKVDSATGNSIYQRINPNGSFSSSFLMISDDGTQIRTHKPKEDRLISNQIEKNKLVGEQFEQEQYEKLVSKGYSPQKQVIVETPSGVRTVLDFIIKENEVDICIECKSSITAPLTKNQKIAFPEIKEKGAIVISSDKEGYPKGTVIKPTEVKIERKIK